MTKRRKYHSERKRRIPHLLGMGSLTSFRMTRKELAWDPSGFALRMTIRESAFRMTKKEGFRVRF